MKFSIFEIVPEAYSHFLENYKVAFQISWFWFTLVLLMAMLPILFGFPDAHDIAQSHAAGQLSTTYIAMFLVSFVVSILAYSAVGVHWYRFVINEERPQSTIGAPLDKSVFRFLKMGVIYFLIFAGIHTVIAAIMMTFVSFLNIQNVALVAILFGALFVAVSILITSRFVLIWPAAAVNQRSMSLVESWRATKGASIKIFLAFIVLAVPILMVVFGLSFSLGLLTAVTGVNLNIFNTIIATGVGLVQWLITATIISSFFRISKNETPALPVS